MENLDSIVKHALSRRTFLAGAGSAAALTAVAGCSNGIDSSTTTVTAPPTPTGYTDLDVLNFALNLEYLEAEFYLRAATGSGLAAADIAPGSSSNTTTGAVTTMVGTGSTATNYAVQLTGLTAEQQDIVNEIAYEEQAHVQFLRSALGADAVARPAIDLTFFGPLAMVAGITTDTSFSPFTSFDAFLIGSFVFEDVGVTAYAGAAPLITAAGVKAGYLSAAAGILAVEAYHAGYVRTVLTANAIAAGTAGTMYPYVTIANQVEDLRAKLTVGNSAAPGTSGSVETPLTVPTNLTTPSSIVAADPTNAIGFSRTVNQVLHIVYGSATVGVAKGGFYPNGVNSIFATTTA